MITQNQTKPAQPAAPTSTTSTTSAPAPAQPVQPILEMHDAPYSWTVTVIDPNGFSEMFTVRAVSERGFFERIARTKAQLIADNYKPAPARGTSASAPAAPEGEQAPLCAIHKTPMQRRQGKNGQTFYSCATKLDTGEWCPYKAPRQ